VVDCLGPLRYNRNIVRKITIKVKPKHREHIILFCAGTPFKQKVVESKVKYKRQPKHKGQHND